MRYQRLVDKIAGQTNLKESQVRDVLSAFAEVLMDLQPEARVLTPLGAFYGKYRESKRVRLPDGSTTISTPEFAVRLREGKSLTKKMPK